MVWYEIAGGELAPDRAQEHLRHVSDCDYCGALLQAAVSDLNEETTASETEEIAALKSAQPEWQRRLARQIAGTITPEPVSWWLRWKATPRLALVAAGLIVVAGGSWIAVHWRDSDSVGKLLARAYTEQRTLEVRFEGAAYAPLRVQKGPEASFADRTPALLKAEALVASQLPSHPSDPSWLQAKARADLLEGKYDAAVESLRRALELSPNSPDLMVDLASAYFQRAQTEDHPQDYGAAYEFLSRVLQQRPEDPVALFNRAIVAEHQFLYHQALEDWEHYLRVDARSEWADEARSHAEAVRSKLKEQEGKARPLLSPAEVDVVASAEVEQRIEQYLDAAVQSWLPQAYPEAGTAGDPHAQQALFFLADLTRQKHNDRWLSDLLRGSSAPTFARAVAALARASQTNYSGDYTIAREQASVAAGLFRASGNQAGVLRAQFEHAFSDQLTGHTAECRRDATIARVEAERLPYSWLQIQLGLEKAVCSFLGQDWGADERLSRQAMDRARESGYDSLYVRALYFIADDQVAIGDLSAGLEFASIALERYWTAPIPSVRAYNLYGLLGSVPEFTAKQPHLVMAIWREATALMDSSDNILVRAWTHSSAARAAAAIHRPEIAKGQYAEAVRLFALAPRTNAAQSAILWDEIRAAGVEARLGQFDSGIARLTRIQEQLRLRSDKEPEEMFYAILGELQLRSHHAVQAEQAFQPALESAEQRLISLNSEAERINWSREAAPVYLGMAEAELVQGHAQESLEYFEWYLGAAARSGAGSASARRKARSQNAAPDPTWLTSRIPLLSGRTVLAYAALPDGLAIWTYDNRGINAQWIPQSTQGLQELVARFYDLASDPKSEATALRRDARGLYTALIAPVEQRIEPGRTLVIETDGWLAQVPFEALLDSSGHYLIERAPVVHSLGQRVDASLYDDVSISKDLHALIVGSAASSQTEGLVPLPDVLAEAEAVARDFHSPEVLKGSDATLSAVERELPSAAVFHFTGHSLARAQGAGLMLEATSSQDSKPLLLSADRLRRLDLRNMRLAVLSTCNAESGKDGSRGFNRIAESLQRAGVPHVVASRWAVDSEVTREFVETFYRNELSGQPVSEAIRQTSRHLLADPRTSHPYYWSAFLAYGRP
jgi:CHAT domain-containing protein/cytochrome c-type biogenesis protein CcmH/NrfG